MTGAGDDWAAGEREDGAVIKSVAGISRHASRGCNPQNLKLAIFCSPANKMIELALVPFYAFTGFRGSQMSLTSIACGHDFLTFSLFLLGCVPVLGDPRTRYLPASLWRDYILGCQGIVQGSITIPRTKAVKTVRLPRRS
jgi:hypothetical protein